MPEFPLWWLEKSKRNMSGLPDIAAHLHEKTQGFEHHDPGVRGETSEVEKQLIEHLSNTRQQVSILSDVVQSLLQIIAQDHERRSSQRAKKALRRALAKGKEYRQKTSVRTVLWALGAIATAGTLWAIITWVLHLLYRLRR